MSAVDKTRGLVRCSIPLDQITANKNNPNVMNSREFDLLVDNLQHIGFTDPVLLHPSNTIDLFEGTDAEFQEWAIESGMEFTLIGGHHRCEGARYLDFTDVPATIVTDPDFTGEHAEMQLLRHNMIHGSLDPKKFMDLYKKYEDEYSDDEIQDMFGFANEAEFRALVKSTAESLPKDMQKAFKDAAKEIKTVDDLSKVLNHLFSTYGDTLEYGYMMFDFNGSESLWVRMRDNQKKEFYKLGTFCKDNNISMDALMFEVVRGITKGKVIDTDDILAELPKVENTGNAFNAEDVLND